MTEQEEKIVRIDNKVDVLATKVDAFIQEMRDFKTEMRDRDNQRAAETAALRAEMRESDKAIRAEMVENNKKITEEVSAIKTELKGLDKYFHNITLAALAGIGAAVIGVLVGAGTMVYTALTK